MASRVATKRLLPARYPYPSSFSGAFASSSCYRAVLTLPQTPIAQTQTQTHRPYSSLKLSSESPVSLRTTSASAASSTSASPSPWSDDGPVSVAAAATAAATPAETSIASSPDRPLAKLPLYSLLRGLLVQEGMSRPGLAGLASNMLRNNIQHLTGNPLSKFILDKMLYAQFCAGRTQPEIQQTVDGLREMGYGGVILTYAREADLSGSAETGTETGTTHSDGDLSHKEQVAQWLKGSLQTIEYANRGDFVALKYTGAGDGCVHELTTGAAPDPIMADALHRVCHSAKQQGVKLLVDAEHHAQQHGIDRWTMALMEKYNRDGQIVVYNTYQMYLKECASTLAAHLQLAREGGFSLGVKLVRGAYINSDPRHLIHDTKEDTDRAFDDAASMLATQHVGDAAAPTVSLVLASHNKASMDMMRDLRRGQMRQGLPLTDVVYAQLMGMADELSLTLMQKKSDTDENARVFKYVVWGSTEECMMYLLRRAEENREAMERSSLSRRAMLEELRARFLSF